MLVLGRMDCNLTEARDLPHSVGARPLVDSTAEVAVASEHHEATDRDTELSPFYQEKASSLQSHQDTPGRKIVKCSVLQPKRMHDS